MQYGAGNAVTSATVDMSFHHNTKKWLAQEQNGPNLSTNSTHAALEKEKMTETGG